MSISEENKEETLDSVFNRLTQSSSQEIDNIDLKVSEETKLTQALAIGNIKFGKYVVLNNIRLSISAVIIITCSILIYLMFTDPPNPAKVDIGSPENKSNSTYRI